MLLCLCPLIEARWFKQHSSPFPHQKAVLDFCLFVSRNRCNISELSIGPQGFFQFTVCGICHLFSVSTIWPTEDILDTCLPTWGFKSLTLCFSIGLRHPQALRDRFPFPNSQGCLTSSSLAGSSQFSGTIAWHASCVFIARRSLCAEKMPMFWEVFYLFLSTVVIVSEHGLPTIAFASSLWVWLQSYLKLWSISLSGHSTVNNSLKIVSQL